MLRERLLFISKIILSVVALIFVLKKINFGDITDIIYSAERSYLIFALILFIFSKIMSALRSFLIFKTYNIPISRWENLKLYWTGMVYNLFFPGGIGGDIYKTVFINKMHGSGLKVSTVAVLMDRISGAAALLAMAFVCKMFTDLYYDWKWISIIGIPFTIAGFFVFVLIFAPKLKGISGQLLGWSFLVQGLQLVSVFFILKAYDINTSQLDYLLIFLVSSLAAMLPISVGGVGIRELVFFSLSDYLLLDQKIGVTISVTFYLITVIGSSAGLITVFDRKKKLKLKTVNY